MLTVLMPLVISRLRSTTSTCRASLLDMSGGVKANPGEGNIGELPTSDSGMVGVCFNC